MGFRSLQILSYSLRLTGVKFAVSYDPVWTTCVQGSIQGGGEASPELASFHPQKNSNCNTNYYGVGPTWVSITLNGLKWPLCVFIRKNTSFKEEKSCFGGETHH